MSELIAVVGESGTGKSTSIGQIPELGIKGLNPKETVIMNIMGKSLPFKGWKKNYIPNIQKSGNYFQGTSAPTIIQVMEYINAKRPEIKNIIVDDGQYIMADKFMADARKKGYEKFSELGQEMYNILNKGKSMREDLKVFFLMHSESSDYGSRKIKTIGRMLDEKVTLEGLFTIVLYTKVTFDSSIKKSTYEFVTNFDGVYPAKSPVGMFENNYIPNDLGAVVEAINEYYN